jgi:hypothetical protein
MAKPKTKLRIFAIASCVCLLCHAHAWGDKPAHAGGGGGGNSGGSDPVGETVYFYHGGALQRMAPDGSGKAPLLQYTGWDVEPSVQLHGGGRWFLDVTVGGLDAVKQDGTRVALVSPGDNGDWLIEGGSVRWVSDGDVPDAMASWVSSRSDDDSVQRAIVRAPLVFDAQTGDVAGLDLTQIQRFEAISRYYDWSPNGEWLTFCDEDTGTLWVYDTLAQQTQLLAADGAWFTPAWSPDGSRIAYTMIDRKAGVSQLKTIDVLDRTVTVVDEGRLRGSIEGTIVYDGEWSPDSSQLVYEKYSSPGYEQNHDIVVRNANGKGGAKVLTKELDTWSSLALVLGWRAN